MQKEQVHKRLTDCQTRHYLRGINISGEWHDVGSVRRFLAVFRCRSWYVLLANANGNVAEYISGSNGNITAYLDETGAIVAEYTCDPFGATITQSGSHASHFPHRFSTKYHDPETGLYYYGCRFYDPLWSRWLNRDPIEEEGGLNLYAFCGNDGVNRWDVLGLLEEGEKAIIDCKGEECKLVEGVIPGASTRRFPYLKDTTFLMSVANSLRFTWDNYIESGFAIFSGGKYGNLVYSTDALETAQKAKERYSDSLKKAEQNYNDALEKITKGNFHESFKDRKRKEAYTNYQKALNEIDRWIQAMIGDKSHQTPINLLYIPDQITNYHTHDIPGPPSKGDIDVLNSIANRDKSKAAVWGALSSIDRSRRGCRKAELKLYSSSGRVYKTGVFILY